MRVRFYIFAALSAVALIPIVFFGIWPHSKALQNEIEEVSDRHLLLAKNLGHALQRYDRDVRAIFLFTATNAIRNVPLQGSEDITSGFHMRHICITALDSPEVVASALTNVGACPARVPDERFEIFLELAEEGRVRYTAVMAGPEGTPLLYLVTKIEQHLAIGAMRTDYFVALGKAIAFGEGGHAAIVDHTGRVLAHPREDWRLARQDMSAVSPVKRMLNGETGTSKFFSPAAKTDMIAGFTTVPGPNWGVMIPQPFAELVSKARDVQTYALSIILFGLLVAAVASWFISGIITRPIHAVAKAAGAMATGNENARVERLSAPRIDEFSDLADSFNQMAESVGEALHNENEARVHAEQASAALKISHERFRAVVDNSAAAIVLLTRDGHTLLTNHQFEEWFAIEAGRYDRDPVWGAFDQEVATQLANQASQAIETVAPIEREYGLDFADGSPHVLAVTMFPVFGHSASDLNIGSVMVDVSAQRFAEDQLRRSQRLEAIGQLTGGIAHDFNNLLAVIMGHADVLVLDSKEQNGPAESILRAAKRGAELTQRLLAYARQQTLVPKAIDVDKLVKGLHDLFDRTLGEAIQVEITTEPGLWPALADAGQLESALLNLSINARDAMPKGGTLSIKTRNVTVEDGGEGPDGLEPGQYVATTVTDTGSGIPAAHLARVFEPFFTTKDVGEGSGLGLSMVYGFARQSGGRVGIESQEGKGTAVTIYVPAARQAIPQVEPENEAPVPHSGGGATVLILEDDREVLELAHALFLRLGYKAVCAHSGTEALEILASGRPIDLMLSDVILPGGVDGIAIATKAQAMREGLKVIFMSGYMHADIFEGRDWQGDFHLLPKPFSLAELTEKLEEVLARPEADAM